MSNSTTKGKNKIKKGIKIQILILRRQIVAEINPPKQKAPLSPINTLAGLILKKRNATKIAIQIPKTVVAR